MTGENLAVAPEAAQTFQATTKRQQQSRTEPVFTSPASRVRSAQMVCVLRAWEKRSEALDSICAGLESLASE